MNREAMTLRRLHQIDLIIFMIPEGRRVLGENVGYTRLLLEKKAMLELLDDPMSYRPLNIEELSEKVKILVQRKGNGYAKAPVKLKGILEQLNGYIEQFGDLRPLLALQGQIMEALHLKNGRMI